MNESLTSTKKCARCGKTILQSTRGSLTAWLFRKAECNCESQGNYLETKPEAPQGDACAATHVIAKGIETGQILNGRFEVLETLGKGGMSTVYRVMDKSSGQVYALKVMIPKDLNSKNSADKLDHEAIALKELSHVNICTVYEVGRSEEGTPYLLMDYIVGKTLAESIASSGTFSETRALKILIQICQALAYAHARGVVHCDIKPSNIILTKTLGNEELVKIVDFGIARISDNQYNDDGNLPESTEICGSPLYMSPEQCRGQVPDARSDIYSFAVLAFALLSGKPVFTAENPVGVILKHLQDKAPTLPDPASSAMKELIARCLEKERNKRYQTADALLADLINIKEGKALSPLKTQRTGLRFNIKAIVLCGAFISAGALLLKPSIEGKLWEYNRESARKHFNSGNYKQAEIALLNSMQLAGENKSREIETLEDLLILQHVLLQKPAEDKYFNEINRIASREGSPQKSVLNKTLLHKYLEELPVDEPRRGKCIESLTYEVLKSAIYLNREQKYDQAVQIVDLILPILKKQLGPDSALLANLLAEKRSALEKKIAALEKEGSDQSLLLAWEIAEFASCYAKNDPEKECRLCETAVRLVLQFEPEQLTGKARARAADILAAYTAILKRTGLSDWKFYEETADKYRFND